MVVEAELWEHLEDKLAKEEIMIARLKVNAEEWTNDFSRIWQILKEHFQVLVYRLKVSQRTLISPYQNGFVPGSCITDSDLHLLTHEFYNFITKKKQGKTGWSALKVDNVQSLW